MSNDRAVLAELARPSLLSRAGHRWLDPGSAGPTVEKLRSRLARNSELGWKVLLMKGIRFARSTAVTRYLLRDVNEIGIGVRVAGVAPLIDNIGATIVVGDDVVFASPRTPIYVAMKPGAFLSIGKETWMNDGVWFGCTKRITIGERVLIGPGVRIFDSDYHDLYQRRQMPPSKPVAVEDDVWIASDAILLPGVTIGRGAVIGANTVVRHDVSPFSVVAGNPARLIKTLDPQLFAAMQSSAA